MLFRSDGVREPLIRFPTFQHRNFLREFIARPSEGDRLFLVIACLVRHHPFLRIITALIRKRMWELEGSLARDAVNGCSIAEQLSPKALRDWVLAQPELGGNVKLPTTIIQYIDDCSGCALSKYRAIAGLVFTWSVMDKVYAVWRT